MRIFLPLIAYVLLSSSSYAAIPDIEAALMNKDYAQVRTLAQGLLQSKDRQERVEAQYYLGLSQLRLGQYADARKAFGAVKDSSPGREMYDKAAVGVMESLYTVGFYKEALKEGEALLRKSPDSQLLTLIYLKMARAHLKLREWEQARDYLTRIVQKFPASVEYPIARQLLEERDYFSVQVGAFKEQPRAVQLAEELKAKDQYAYIVETTSPQGEKFFRVRVGQLTSLEDAQALETRLAQLGYPTRIYP